jgi:hypothetical protein
MKARKAKKNRTKLTGKTRELASKFIAEEMETHRYPRKQAVAIGISRARRAVSKTSRTLARLEHLLAKYK